LGAGLASLRASPYDPYPEGGRLTVLPDNDPASRDQA